MSNPFDEKRLEAVIEHSLDAVALVELDGTLTYVTPSIVRVLGYRPEEFLRMPAFEAVHPDDRDEAMRRLAELAGQPGASQTVVNRVRHKDGSWRWIETVSTNQIENPNLRAIVASLRDVTDRKRFEEALHDQEESFRLVIESAVDFAIFTMGLDGRIQSWNSGAERILGYTEEEILGHHVGIIFTPEENAQGRVEFEMHGAAYAGHENDDRWHLRKGGIRFWANGTMMPLKDEAGALKGYLKILRDRTARKLARDALEASEKRLRIASDAAGLGLWHCDLGPDKLSCDHRCREHSGLPPDVEAGIDGVYDRIHPEDRERIRKAVERSIAEHKPFDGEYRTVAPDGRVRWIEALGRAIDDESGAAYRFDGVTIDVTERKRAEESLRESEGRFRSMADASPVMIWMADAGGRRTYFNKSWLDFTGRSMEQALSHGSRDGIHAEDRERWQACSVSAFDGRKSYEVEYRLGRFDGDHRWVFEKAGPLFTPAGDFTGYVGTCIDITDRRLAEEALKDADRRKDEFLAMLAHELRNPLAAINNAVQLSLRGARDEHLEWSKEVIDRQGRHLARLIDDLLDVSRITRGKIQLRKERIDLVPVIARAVESVRPLIEAKKHNLILSIAQGPMEVFADPTRMEQIFVNLLSNATKYTDDGGRITLAADCKQDVVVTVKDNGVGIQPAMLPRIFELFAQADWTIDRSQGGLGIGLTLVERLVEMHGGTVRAESDGPGKGCVFTVRFPVAATPAAVVETPPSPPVQRRGGLRLLVVDDNQDTAAGLTRLLRISGYQVTTAHDGPTALEVARAERPDAILMDIGLPGMDGYSVAEQLRGEEDSKGAILIAISGYGQERDLLRSREAGFDHHFVKPVDYDALLSLLSKQEKSFPASTEDPTG